MSWKNMTFGTKIAVGFALVLVLLALVGVLSFNGVNRIVGNAEEVIHGNKLDGNLAQKEVDHLNWANKVNGLITDDKVTALHVETDDHKCAFGKWLYGEGRKHAEELVPSLAPLFKEIEEPHRKLHESAIEIGKHFQQADTDLGNFLREKKTDHLAWTHRVKDVFLDDSLTRVNVEKDPAKCSLGRWMNSAEVLSLKQKEPQFASLMAELDGPHRALHESAITIENMIQNGQRDAALAFYMRKTSPLAKECLHKIDNILRWHDQKVEGMQKAGAVYAGQTIPTLAAIQRQLVDIREEARSHIMTDQVMLDAAQGTKRNVTVVSVVAIIAGIVLAFFIARGIVSVLKRISQQMDQGAEQVAAASGQVSSSSQQLAEGASEQAASIEETSSSLEEMSSMTKQNAGNATQADTLMKEANQVVVQANSSMADLTGSMDEISKASEETSKIIKTIDEIAFQTNLLALNAAVEAARAGEAGAGFAVVADEVRNLAMRAADAAKSTSGLIEGTVKKVNDGSELVTKTNEAFTQVAESAKKVGELVSEIAAASDEQAQGIGQVNSAVTEMDKVVQSNAANAEESASASEEMNAQAEQMKASVGELMKLVGGGGKGSVQASGAQKEIVYGVYQMPASVNKKNYAAAPQQVSSPSAANPEKIIPLNNEDFADF